MSEDDDRVVQLSATPDAVTLIRVSAPARLITIPISHFCEKARWALRWAGIPYVEEPHVQVLHRLYARRAGGGKTVPVLVTAEDGVFTESTDILAYADRTAARATGRRLYPATVAGEVRALEADFDAHLGPDGRRWMYSQALPHRDVFASYNVHGVPAWERVAFPVMYPLASRAITRILDVTPETAAASEQTVWRTFDAVQDQLADGRAHLCGDEFTAADLAFAALAAAVVVPPEYGVPLPQPDEMPEPMASSVRAFRAHPAGAYALKLFAARALACAALLAALVLAGCGGDRARADRPAARSVAAAPRAGGTHYRSHPQVSQPEAGVAAQSDPSEVAPESLGGASHAPSDAEVRREVAQIDGQLRALRASERLRHGPGPLFAGNLLDPAEVAGLGGWKQSVASTYFKFGEPLACGGRLARDTLGVAHKSMPCGTMVTFRYRDRAISVPVIDRGPYIAGREWDLTGPTAIALDFPGLGPIDWTLR